MRILILTSSLPMSPDDSVPGFVRDQAIALKNADNSLEIEILAPHTKKTRVSYRKEHPCYVERRFHYFWPFSYEKLADGGIVPNLNKNKLLYFQIPFLFLGQICSTYKIVKKTKPSVIYAHWFTPQAISGAIVAGLTNTQFAFTSHSMDVIILKKLPVLGPTIVKMVINKAFAFTAVSQKTLRKIQHFYPQDEWNKIARKAHIIPMGINIEDYSSGKIDHSTPGQLLFIGRLVEKKGLSYLLQSLLILREREINFKLHLCGEGQEKENLKNFVTENNLEKYVEFHGYVHGEKKRNLLELCEISLVPSIDTRNDTEGLPVTIMEAMASKKIVIATYDSGAAEIITHQKNGLLVNGRDCEALANAIIDAMNLIESKSSMGEQAAIRIQAFSWKNIAPKTLELLKLQNNAI